MQIEREGEDQPLPLSPPPSRSRSRSRSTCTCTCTCTSSPSFDAAIFPLLLASAARDGNEDALLRRLLRRIRSRCLPPSTCACTCNSGALALPPSLLSLLPLLLSSRCDPVAVLSAQLLSAASLMSLDQNHTIASDSAILSALLWSLTSGTPQRATSVLTALLDLSVSSFARARLRHAGAVPKLL